MSKNGSPIMVDGNMEIKLTGNVKYMCKVKLHTKLENGITSTSRYFHKLIHQNQKFTKIGKISRAIIINSLATSDTPTSSLMRSLRNL